MENVATTPELLLARRASKADPGAWDEIVARFGDRIYGIAYRFAGNAPEAEELTQDVFLKLYQSLHQYRGDVPFVAWALRLSRNLCIDHYRHHRQRLQSEVVSDEVLRHVPSAGENPHEARWLAERREMVHRTLAEMPEEMATVILLRDLQGLAYDEVAAFLDLPLGTVKSRLNRARRELVDRLRSTLDAREPDADDSLDDSADDAAREAAR